MPETFASSILQWEMGDAPCAWGAAENQPGLGGNAGESYAAMYRRLGLQTLSSHATLDGGTALAPQIDLINSMLSTGKLKISRKCADLLAEMQGWEYDEKGKPIAKNDDLVAALRYAVMMAPRFSKVMDVDRVRRGLGQRGRRGAYQARDVEFDLT